MPYKLSRDYHRLWAELQIESVVCFADYHTPVEFTSTRDVCRTMWTGKTAHVGCRGVCYVWAKNEEDFVRACEAASIEALFPEAADA